MILSPSLLSTRLPSKAIDLKECRVTMLQLGQEFDRNRLGKKEAANIRSTQGWEQSQPKYTHHNDTDIFSF
jgi:hypothetical protein